MRVAVIGGTGRFGSAIACRLADEGHHVIIGSRAVERAVNMAAVASALTQAGAPVEGARNADAVSHAEIVVLTVPAHGHAAVLREVAHNAAGRIVVDTCVCHHPRRSGVWVRPPAGSAAMRVRRWLPRSAAVAATLHAVPARALRHRRQIEAGDVPIAADGASSMDAARWLLQELGLQWVEAGGLEVAASLEHLAVLMSALADANGAKAPAARFVGLPRGAPTSGGK